MSTVNSAKLPPAHGPNARYGFIGLGNMGLHMARNIAKKMDPGAHLTVCDVDASRVTKMLESASGSASSGHIDSAATPREVIEKADLIITSLPAAKHVEEVFFHPETGLLTGPIEAGGKLFLETSTIEVSASTEVSNRVHASKIGRFLDSPVSGGPEAAELGTLSIMVGGDHATFQHASPLLEYMGLPNKIFHCGQSGAGLATKQLNNYAANVSYLGLCEAMNIGVRWGLDPKTLSSVINASSGMSWNSLNQNPVKGVNPKSSSSRDFEGGFPTELCQGVINMALQLAEQVGAKTVVGPVIREFFAEAVQDPRCKGKECRSVYRLIENKKP